MLFKTIELNIKNADLTVINNAINDIIYKKYWDKKREDYETATQMNHRITWINHDFCLIKDLAEMNNTSESYLHNIYSIIGWKDIKHDLLILYDKRDALEKEQEKEEAVDTQLEIWKQTISSIKYDLNKLAIRKKQVDTAIKVTTDKKELVELYNERSSIVFMESQLRKDMSTAQKNQRTALGLTNNYKDITPEKFEIEQKGELTLNQNVNDGLSKEEREKAYEVEFKQLLQEATTYNGTDVQDI